MLFGSPSKIFLRSRPQSKSDSPDQDEEQSSIDATPETSPRLRKMSSFQRLHMPHLSLSTPSTSESRVLIERLGGQDVVRAVAEALLDRTSKDALLAPFYEGVDVKRLADMYTTFLVCACFVWRALTPRRLQRPPAAGGKRGAGPGAL